MNWIGRSLPRLEDPSLLRECGSYVADRIGKAAAVRFVRSPLARGTITDIEIPPGATVFTGRDLIGVKSIRPILHRPDYVAIGQPVLPVDRVTFCGQAIAEVDAALVPGAAPVHPEAPSNVLVEGRMKTAGLDKAFADAVEIVALELR